MEFDQLRQYDMSKINYLTNKQIEDIDMSVIVNNIPDKSIILFGIADDAKIPSVYQMESSSMGNALGSCIGALVSSLFDGLVEQNRLGDFDYNNDVYETKTYKYERGNQNKEEAIDFGSTAQPSVARGAKRNSNRQYHSIDYFVYVDKVLYKNNDIMSLLFYSFNNLFPNPNNMHKYTDGELCKILQSAREYALANNQIIYL